MNGSPAGNDVQKNPRVEIRFADKNPAAMRRMVFFAFTLVATACLAGGLALAGQWLVAPGALLAGLCLLLNRRWPAAGLATIALILLTALAVVGLAFHAAPLLMLAGATAALAAWDLASLETTSRAANRLPSNETPDHAAEDLFEQRRMRLLVVAIGAGLLAAGLGQVIQLRLSFIVVLLAAGVMVWALERALGGLK